MPGFCKYRGLMQRSTWVEAMDERELEQGYAHFHRKLKERKIVPPEPAAGRTRRKGKQGSRARRGGYHGSK